MTLRIQTTRKAHKEGKDGKREIKGERTKQ